MKLRFQPQRLVLIARLRGLSQNEIICRMNEYQETKFVKHPVDRWMKGIISPREDRIDALCHACNVPESFFFFFQLKFEVSSFMPHEMKITVVDTDETIKIALCSNSFEKADAGGQKNI